MTRINLPNQPRLKLTDVLKRRKSTLKQFIDEHGITTLGGLNEACHRLGVAGPTEDEFHAVVPRTPAVSNPQEGVVVVDPLPIVDEATGRQIDVDAPVHPKVEVVTEEEWEPPTEAPTKPQFKKNKGNKA